MSPKSCLGCTKWFLFLLNLLFFFLGIFLLAFSFWLLFDRQSFATVLGSPLVSLRVWSYAFSGVGIATMLLGFLGCLGALKEVKVMLGLLATKVAVYTEELIRGYPAQGPPGDTHESWDAVQQQLGCCGWKGPQDWDHHDDATRDRDGAIACSCLRAHNSTHKTPSMFPHGRCPMAALQDIFPRLSPQGCKERVQTWLAGNLVTIVGVCIGIGLGELFLLMLSMFLVRNLDSHYEKLLRGL
ncbi:leukocyte antigen CD37 isoform X10 [Poecile atricapillus]|uniref:leukocyte antigen CD37 isoform X10 n=1 Tax=Poecile atricapillus TaxID=48891 RepID=UPI002739BBD7|nr:leukocyte antigen CD37 isoform X10 [Poecile atricapillus]